MLYLRSYRSEIARIRKLKMGLSQSPAGRLEPRYVAAIAVSKYQTQIHAVVRHEPLAP